MFIQTLESRTLMSASVDSTVNTAVAADRIQVHADLLQFRSDLYSAQATMMKDVSALVADDVKKDTLLSPLFKKLRVNLNAMHKALKADRMSEGANVLADEATILAAQAKYHADAGNATARKADRKAIVSARIQLQTDEIAGLNARLTERQNDYTVIFNTLTAIANAVDSDAGASAQVKADVHTFVTDKTNILNTFTAALQKIITDRTQLVTDLTALESSL